MTDELEAVLRKSLNEVTRSRRVDVALFVVSAVREIGHFYFANETSTRRFSALPLAVALSATGLVAPKPCG
jgi:hypothetical protein